jgi:NADH-quinone oxidoreductase subunit G
LASQVFARLAAEIAAFVNLTYQDMAIVGEQWPIVGRGDLYYGGTTYENSQGLGVQLALSGQPGLTWPSLPEVVLPKIGLLAVPITRLYDRGTTLLPSEMLHARLPEPYVVLNPSDAERYKIQAGMALQIIPAEGSEAGLPLRATARLDGAIPERALLVPRSIGLPVFAPKVVTVRIAEKVLA